MPKKAESIVLKPGVYMYKDTDNMNRLCYVHKIGTKFISIITLAKVPITISRVKKSEAKYFRPIDTKLVSLSEYKNRILGVGSRLGITKTATKALT